MTQQQNDPHVEALTDYIMKHCLWCFHSRAWDRERQNKEVLGWATKVLQGSTEVPSDAKDKCHWVDGVVLARAYRQEFKWINGLNNDQISELMAKLKDRLDYLTISGSLNEELTQHIY